MAGAGGPTLEPYEHHVRELIDAERSTLEVCRESEIGDNETLRCSTRCRPAGSSA